MRKSLTSLPYSDYKLLYMIGYYKDGMPNYNTSDYSLLFDQGTVTINTFESSSIFDTIGEFTIAPNVFLKQDKGYVMGLFIHKNQKRSIADNKAHAVNAPYITGSPIVYECRMKERKKNRFSTTYIAEIANITVHDKLFNSSGELDIASAFRVTRVVTQ